MNPVFVKNLDARQQTLSGYVELKVSDFVARDNVIDVELPYNSEITLGAMTVIDPSDQQTSDTVSVGDSANATRYLGATSIKAAAGTRTALVPTGFITTPDNCHLRFTRTPAGTAATKGTIRIWFSYLQLGQSDFTQG
jgi:hypothetical protein